MKRSDIFVADRIIHAQSRHSCPPKRLTLIAIAALGLALIVPAVSQDRMVLGPRQFETDKSGAGAVLCVWSIYLSVQA